MSKKKIMFWSYNKCTATVLYSVLPDAEVKLCETDSKNTVPFQNVV